MTEQRKAVIKNADMSEEMQQDAVDIASQALAKYNIEKVRDLCLYFSCAEKDLFCKRFSWWMKGWNSTLIPSTLSLSIEILL
jgi:hypothetical protein